ncbi:2-hydroxyacid dehydrogenase [Benzoatithermus flavus]|uniref:Glyoxylate/hydroxypyruvate reductase A n=1 Tax=Benzoatithermus flavus TaxID=3108223 RepID=A0ABU8XK52_9PROT
MALLFYSLDDDAESWGRELRRHLPDLDYRVWPETGDLAEIDAALVWKPPPGLLRSLPNLKAILSLAAGVDAMLADPTLPDVPLCRLVDPSLTRTMSEFVLLQALKYHRGLDVYAGQQRAARWRLHLPLPPSATTVGIMGLGVLGEDAARTLRGHGFSVRGWSRTEKRLEGIACFSGEAGLDAFLAETRILVCLLPLTPETRGILDARLFARLPKGARLVNVARGAHLVERDLIEALDRGQLAHASLDVFQDEPLPPDHPFWRHPAIDVTPHAASYGLPESAAQLVAENYRRLREGRPLLHVVDRARGY